MDSVDKRITFRDFINFLERCKLIIFGEIHGTKEIPLHEKKVLQELSDKISLIFLEIPKGQQKYIDQYMESKSEGYLSEIPFFKNPSKDGRGSKENLFLIRNLKSLRRKNNKIKIICVDSNEDANRDSFMYNKIKNRIKIKEDGINVFITGNFHANTEKIIVNKKEHKPCGHYLKKWLKWNLVSVNFVPISGRVYNHDILRTLKCAVS